MLARVHRLTTATFANAFRQGRVVRHPLLQLRVFKREDGDETVRAAFVAPKKIGKATERNRLRRRARERFRLSAALSDPKLRGCDLIFFVSPEVEHATPAEIDAALSNLLHRAARR